jgi:hypothetical protein
MPVKPQFSSNFDTRNFEGRASGMQDSFSIEYNTGGFISNKVMGYNKDATEAGTNGGTK